MKSLLIPIIVQEIISFTTVHSVYHLIRWVFFEYCTCVKRLPLLPSVINTDHFPFEWVLAKPTGFCVVNLVQSRMKTSNSIMCAFRRLERKSSTKNKKNFEFIK